MGVERFSRLVESERFQRGLPAYRWIVALGSAWLIALFFALSPIQGNLTSFLVALDLDPARAALVDALIFAAGSALVAGLCSRHLLAAMVGASTAYAISYVLPFLYQEQIPAYDPGGHLEALNILALAHTVAVLIASSLLCAFIGAATGKALSETLFDPVWQLARAIWHGSRQNDRVALEQLSTDKLPARRKTQTQGARHRQLVWRWSGLIAMLAILFVSGGMVNLLTFSPDTGLHNPPPATMHGTLIADSLISPSLHDQRRSFLIYLPPSYQQDRTRRYPTLYLLHGSPGSEYDWTRGGKAVQSANTLISQGSTSDLIMVFPDGNGRSGETSEWGNSFDHKQLMENFVALDLVHYVDQKYRTIPQPADRALGGLSMGGFGAMNIAVHHPNIFGSVIALGGYYKAEGGIWGGNAAYIRKNSPAFTLPATRAAWKLRMFLGAATRDQPYYADTEAFLREVKALHVSYTFDLEPGHHAWNVWEIQLYHALTWLRWGKATAAPKKPKGKSNVPHMGDTTYKIGKGRKSMIQ